jgi:hypothetical protein
LSVSRQSGEDIDFVGVPDAKGNADHDSNGRHQRMLVSTRLRRRAGYDISCTVNPSHCSGAKYGAPPNVDTVTAHSDSDVVHWLINDTREKRFIDNIFAELYVRLQRAGIPVKRASLHVLINHPHWLGARIMWADGMREAEIARVDYDVRERSEYFDSPANVPLSYARISNAISRWAASTPSRRDAGEA